VIVPGVAAVLSTGLLRLALGDAVTWDLSVQSETRGRIATEGGRMGEVSAEPRAALTLEGRLHSATAAYGPELRIDSETSRPTVLHAGALSGTWRLAPRWHAIAAATGTYGTRDFLLGERPPLASDGAAAPLQPVPAITTIDYGAGSLRLGLGGSPTPRSTVQLGAGSFVEQGLGAVGRVALPPQRGVGADGSLGWAISLADALSATVNGTLTTFPAAGTKSVTAALTTTWRHTFTPRTNGWLGVGPTLSRETGSSFLLAAGGEAGVHHRLVRPVVDTSLSTRVAPITDRITGNVYRRVDLTGTASWVPAARWLLTGTAASGFVLDGPQRGDRLASGEVGLGWTGGRSWGTTGGVRWLWQQGGQVAAGSLHEWMGFAGVTFRERGRF
jgi:hypothetical protein